ncbi:glycosyl hydrolase family 95 catalytic domain-containing protein [Paenibacillus xerothermodurans]|uniref:BIG2 domain-containing protein n=1 Tax=Paenibacillus xerothermodurans TaxID=1977292 RepID=A0A2W1P376_PAEXE|nr:Ig-like domain-containing protein [Paenibacillus xerothermodurans]PZE21618.1 hypothetical protein CBW46_004115 [Paenibacillus xerothermodurans]
MKYATRKQMRTMVAAAVIATSVSALTFGSYPINAKEHSGYTPAQAVIDHLNKDDWSEIQKLLTDIYGSVTSPLKITDVSQGKYTQGQLMGNGDIGVIAAGVSTTSQQFYFGKNDFWGTTHGEASRIRDQAGVLSGGGLDIWPTTAAGSSASSVFNMKQDILNAQVITNIELKDNDGNDAKLEMNSWTADTDNVFVTELTNSGAGAVTLNTKLWVPAKAYPGGGAAEMTDAQTTYPYTGGIEATAHNHILWTTRDSSPGESGSSSNYRSRMATAATVVGAELTNLRETREANDYYDHYSKKYQESLGEAGDFTVEPGKKVYLVSYFASSSGAFDKIKSVEDVRSDALRGIAAYRSEEAIVQLKNEHLNWWKNYWLKSYTQFNDPELNKYYYGSLYILGSSNRPTSPNGKVNPQNLPAPMYGSWIPADNMGWGGRYFLNYNQQAHYYGAGSANRIDTAVPYNHVIAYNLPWQINNAAAQGFDGAAHIRSLTPFNALANPQPAPIAKDPVKTYGFDDSSTDQKSNGLFAAIPMIFYYEYTLDKDYLRNVLYPYLKQLMNFYSDYVVKTDDGNGQYHYTVLGSSIHEGDSADINPDLDIGAMKYLAQFLTTYAPEMKEDKANVSRWKDLSEHTFFPEAMLPKGTFNANNSSNFVPTMIATDYQSPNQPHVDMIEPGDQPVELEGIVFPFQNVQMLDGDKELLQKVRHTLEYMNAWAATSFSGWSSQNNGFPKVYAIMARAGWPAADLIAKFDTALAAKIKHSNLTYHSSGGAVETVGAMEGLNSMLLQSSTTPLVPSTIWVLPNWDMNKSVSFERMGAKGNVAVSSAYDASTKTIPYVDLHSKRNGIIALVNPWQTGKAVVRAVNKDNTLGDAVKYDIIGGKIVFYAKDNTRYMVMNDSRKNTRHVSGINLDKYSSTLIVNGADGTDTTAVTATVYGGPDDTVTWESSDKDVVRVYGKGNSVTIKAVGTGRNKVADVTVTARSQRDKGISETVKVKVADASTVPTGLQLVSPDAATIYGPAATDPSTAKVMSTNRLQLTASMEPGNAYDKRIMWTSSDQNIAMVDKNGLVIGRGHGTVTITGRSMANPDLPPVTATVTVTAAGADHSADETLANVLTAAKAISQYEQDRTGEGGFTRVSASPHWEPNQEQFQKAYINALGVKAKYASYRATDISRDTAYFAAIALNEAIRAIDPRKALDIGS